MEIKELHTESPNPRVTVTIYHDELRALSSALYERCKMQDDTTPCIESFQNYIDVFHKVETLFELVSHGKITKHLLRVLNRKDGVD